MVNCKYLNCKSFNMLHFSCFIRCGRLTTHHADKGYQFLYQFGIGVGALARSVVEAVLEAYADGGGSHADGTGEAPQEQPGSMSEQSMARLRPVAERLLELPGPTQKL